MQSSAVESVSWAAGSMDSPVSGDTGHLSDQLRNAYLTPALRKSLLAWETKGLLIGEAADPEVQRRIREIVSTHPGIKQVNELITVHMGPHSILVNISVDFADELSSNAVEAATADFNRRIKQAIPDVHRVFIEAESWTAHRDQRQELTQQPIDTPPARE